MTKKVQAIVGMLESAYPDAHCELDHETPLQLLIATVLSAQTTDVSVNKVTAPLYRDYPDLDRLLTLSLSDLETIFHPLGFYRMKAQHVYDLLRTLRSRFNGVVPSDLDSLTSLPGVGRKTANVVLSNAFDVPAIAVDTHVFRVSNRIGLTQAKTPEQCEAQLMRCLDRSVWSRMHHLLIFHGRRCCSAKAPNCAACPVRKYCQEVKK